MTRDGDSQVTAGRLMRQLILIGGLIMSVLAIVFIIYPWGGIVPSLLLFFVMVMMLVRAYSAGHRYRCRNCGNVFRAPLVVDLLTGGGIGKNRDGTYHNWKSLTCPKCGQRSRAVVVRVDPTSQDDPSPARAGDAKAGDSAAAGSDSPDASRPGRSRNAKRRRGKRS